MRIATTLDSRARFVYRSATPNTNRIQRSGESRKSGVKSVDRRKCQRKPSAATEYRPLMIGFLVGYLRSSVMRCDDRPGGAAVSHVAPVTFP